jgi:hypothetical protein
MHGKSHEVAALLLIALALSTALIVTEAASALGIVAAPRPAPEFIEEQLVGDSCSVEQTVFFGEVISIAGFEGKVNLTLVDPPKGITGTFLPNSVMLKDSISYVALVVNVAHDVPLGKYTLLIRLVPLPGSNYYYYHVEDKLLLDTNVTLDVVHPCYPGPIYVYNSHLLNTTTTTTMFASTTTTTIIQLSTTTIILPKTTVTTTTTIQAVEHSPLPQVTTSTTTATTLLTDRTTERVSDPSTYAWAVSATVAAVVLAVVLMLQRRKTE